MSDRTWNRLGRRRPYFLVGAILASHRPLLHARFVGAVDGCRAAVDSRRQHQHHDGAVPRVRRRQAARGTAHARLRDAEFLHRHRPDAGERASLPVQRHRRRRSDGERHSAHGRLRVQDRRARLSARGAVDGRQQQRVSARRSRRVPAIQARAAGRARRIRRDHRRHPRDATDDEAARRRPVLHLVCAALHVAVLRPGGGAARLPGPRRAVAAVRRRRRVGRALVSPSTTWSAFSSPFCCRGWRRSRAGRACT